MMQSPSLPPLPSSLSTRLLSTINPETGACKHHPAVQLCELVDKKTRWVVKRKICSKCGARAPVGVSRRMPGTSVVNPSSSRSRASSQSPQPRPSPSTSSRGRSRSASSTDRHRERSASSSRSKSVVQDLTTSKSDGGSERQRTTSTSRSLRERKTTGNYTADHDHHHRRSRSASSTSKQRMLIEAALSSAKVEADTERGLYGSATHHRHQSSNDATAVVPSANVVTPTFHSRALEFTSKVLTNTSPETTNYQGNNDLTPPLTAEQGIREVDKFDESDPFIIIPVINPDDNRMPPPPPPRSPEEMERHMERLKLRQASLRKEYQERRAKMAAVARTTTSSSKRDKVVALVVPADPPAAEVKTYTSPDGMSIHIWPI